MGKISEQMMKEEVTMDLTPMIDCVFLLLIFFMIITEITQADIEQLELPQAKAAKPDDKPPPERLVINIIKQNPNDPNERSGLIKIKGRQYSLGQKELADLMRHEADPAGDGSGRKNNDPAGVSERPLLIRCDRRVEYQYFQQILMLCARPDLGIRIAKIEIAISTELPE